MIEAIGYCQLNGSSCAYEPIKLKLNSCFLIQPFDEEKEQRERAINNALKEFYGIDNYELLKSDTNVGPQASFCDICKKIKSAQYCIADISGEIYKIIVNKSICEKIFLRPNVAIELGLAYGFNKPSLVLSKELNNKRLRPSDIDFVRFVDIKNWSSASDVIVDRLKMGLPHI